MPRHSNEERADAIEIIGALEGLDDNEAEQQADDK